MPWVALSGDTVRLIRLKWKSRKRSWRDNENLIEELIKKKFIMTRQTHDENVNFDKKEIKYSFSHVERKLVEMRCRFQNMMYFIFKCMIYK